MKHLLTLLLLFPLLAFAQTRPLGYATTDSIDVRGALFGQMGAYTIGARMPAAGYEGCRVVGLRLAAACDLGRTRLFVNNLTDTLLSQRQRVYEGWNTVLFNGDGYTLRGDETLFFGFEYNETEDMVGRESGGLCCVGSDTDGAFMALVDGQLLPVSGAGRLCVQLLVDVSTLPAHRLTATMFDTGFKYKQAGDAIEALLTLANTGRDTLRAPLLVLTLGADTLFHERMPDVIAPAADVTWTPRVTLPASLPIGRHELVASLPEVEGASFASSFAVYREQLPRRAVYLEVYTDPSTYLSDKLAQALAPLRASDSVVVVNVHAPGSKLALTDAAPLFERYAYTLPSFTVNRAYFPGEAHIAYDMNDYLSVLPAQMLEAILNDMVLQDLATPSFASLQLTGALADGHLTLTASGQLLDEAEAIYGPVALTLMLTEDNVAAPQQVMSGMGRPTTSSAYRHQAALRRIVTPLDGEPLPALNGDYTTTFSIDLDPAWDPTRLRAVALLTKAGEPDAATLRDYDIINVASLPLTTLTAIEAPKAAAAEGPAYDLQGRRAARGARLVVRQGRVAVK